MTTYLVIGGGSSGCVMASRLSEDASAHVTLIEAGDDVVPDEVPSDISDGFAGHVLVNRNYLWPKLSFRRGNSDAFSERGKAPVFYEQGRVLGGGSSVNGQVAVRGSYEDYDRWAALGASGWDWNSVVPYFRRLETDMNYTDQAHGSEGPITIRRIPVSDWDPFTNAVADVWRGAGHAFREDLNGEFAPGFGPIPVSNDLKGERSSTATGYLSAAVRSRPNLVLRTNTLVRRLNFDGAKVVSVEVFDGKSIQTLKADVVILAAGAIQTPSLLMRSGVGPADHLSGLGIKLVLDKPGVGSNLQDHPLVSISAYIKPVARPDGVQRRNYAYLRFSSGEEGCREGDMLTMAVCKSAWHSLGARLATLSTYVGQSFSKGQVRLTSPNSEDMPDILFNYLSDPRDRRRMVSAYRTMAETFLAEKVREVTTDAFPSVLSNRVKQIGRKSLINSLLTDTASFIMDKSPALRTLLVEQVINDAPPLLELLHDERKLEQTVHDSVCGAYHPSCTAKMGAETDPMAVVDPKGRVYGLDNLFITDASIMPEVTTNNTNIPTIMIAEKIADGIRSRAA